MSTLTPVRLSFVKRSEVLKPPSGGWHRVVNDLQNDHSALELGYKVAGESLIIDRRFQWCSGPPRVPSSLTPTPRQEPRDTLIAGATWKGQSR